MTVSVGHKIVYRAIEKAEKIGKESREEKIGKESREDRKGNAGEDE